MSLAERGASMEYSIKDIDTPHMCPVCGKTKFSAHGSFEICDVCGWENDLVQETEPDETNCANEMSLNQAREYWKKYKKSVIDD